jgi:hypothetical protein
MKEKCPLEGIGTFMARPAVMGRHGMIASAHPLASNGFGYFKSRRKRF